MGGEHWAWLSCDENGEIDEGRAGRIDASTEEKKKKKKRCMMFQWKDSK